MGSLTIALNEPNSAPVQTILQPPATERLSGMRAWHIILPLTIGLALTTAAECHSIFNLGSLRYGFVLSGWWGAMALAMWHLGQAKPAALQIKPRVLFWHAIAATILGILHLLAMAGADRLFFSFAIRTQFGLTWNHYLGLNRWGLEMLVYGFIYGAVTVVRLQLQAQQSALQSLELQRALSASQLHALQMQVEPHFLFNTLNSITTLVELGRQQQAAAMLHHLNVILKSTLRRSTPQKIPLAQELDAVENYLAIEQIRFADRLKLEFRIDPSALNALVPSFLLQPLMENAVRHGIGRLEDGGLIQTSIEKSDGTLFLHVQNNGPGAASASVEGHGIGLRNTATRLAHFYPDRHSFQVGQPETGGFQVRIAIPYETAEA
ncbi:sensor histidine kinase [Terriglobus saanensis]|uniref:Signal transduction histidine kinase, LytS n=1 Tax=Terriglobus saanensis (strain ATCC BAA-1853 / DSM 23119 / SP1PR4) TaxID=401053 RepID=E8V2F8_TERSS|nr:histidine kinase [Terriglobus saanensis]ADV82376.1 signal transduction histidine kinase, LytS [Terriglobus saanensis SP1PR4]